MRSRIHIFLFGVSEFHPCLEDMSVIECVAFRLFSFEKEVSVYTETQVKSDRKFLLIKNAGALGSAQTRPRRKQGSNSFAAHAGGCGSSLCQELPWRAAPSVLSLDFVPTFKLYRS